MHPGQAARHNEISIDNAADSSVRRRGFAGDPTHPGAVAQVVTRLSSELDIKLTPFSEALQAMGSVMGQEKATS